MNEISKNFSEVNFFKTKNTFLKLFFVYQNKNKEL